MHVIKILTSFGYALSGSYSVEYGVRRFLQNIYDADFTFLNGDKLQDFQQVQQEVLIQSKSGTIPVIILKKADIHLKILIDTSMIQVFLLNPLRFKDDKSTCVDVDLAFYLRLIFVFCEDFPIYGVHTES